MGKCSEITPQPVYYTMGRTVTPKYRIEYNESGRNQVQCWNSKFYGRATAINLEAWRVKHNASFLPSGVNNHVTKALGYVLHVSYARIVNQFSGEVVAEARMPMFEVIG